MLCREAWEVGWGGRMERLLCVQFVIIDHC